MRDYAGFVSRLQEHLADDGTLKVDNLSGQSKVAFITHEGRTFDFAATLDQLFDAIEHTNADGLFEGPEASMRLFSVHVSEALDTARDGTNRLELREYGVVAR